MIENGGFSQELMQKNVQESDALSPFQLARSYRCTYLTPRFVRTISSILDVGCGGGFLLRYLNQSDYSGSYLGVDCSNVSLEEARKRFPCRDFRKADIEALPFADNAFDLVYARDVLIHTPDPNRALQELYRVARHVLVRVRTANISTRFTTKYQRWAFVHHFFPVEELVTVLQECVPRPHRIQHHSDWRRRTFEVWKYRTSAPFRWYRATNLFVEK